MISEQMHNLSQSGKDFPVLDNKYILFKKIGTGATCKVKLAKSKENGQIVAVKILTNTGGNLSANKHYNAEIDMLKKIDHPNIINLKDGNRGVIKKPDGRTKTIDYIVLEYAGNGELFDYLFFPRCGFGEKNARYLFKQLIDGIEGCHNAGVAHRDLKTENLMMDSNWNLKIADFGYATLLAGKTGNGILTTALGTISYAAPEILNKKPYVGSTADLFSCGVILFILVTGKLPFGKAVLFDNYYKHFVKSQYENFWAVMSPKIEAVSDEFKSLINLMLAYDPTQRPSITEVKNHAFMKADAACKEEITSEFEKRRLVVVKAKEAEAIEEARKKQKNNRPGGVYRGEDEDESNEEDFVKDERRVEDFVDSNNPYTVKFATNDALQVINKIARYFNNVDSKNKEVTAHDNVTKIKISYETDAEIAENLPYLEIQNLALDVELKRTEDDQLIAEFTKLSGDKMEFFNVYDEYLTYVHAN